MSEWGWRREGVNGRGWRVWLEEERGVRVCGWRKRGVQEGGVGGREGV